MLLSNSLSEIALRDYKEIVCVLCPGADEEIRVREDIENGLACADAVAGRVAENLPNGLIIAAERMVDSGPGETGFKDPVRILKPLYL